jgi:hypothetical protein
MLTHTISRPGGLVSLFWSERRAWNRAMEQLRLHRLRMVFSTPEQWNAFQHIGSWLIFLGTCGLWRPRPGWILTVEPERQHIPLGGQW